MGTMLKHRSDSKSKIGCSLYAIKHKNTPPGYPIGMAQSPELIKFDRYAWGYL